MQPEEIFQKNRLTPTLRHSLCCTHTEGENANDDGEGSEQIDRRERTHPAVL